MTAIVTWNIQNGKGCDGITDLARIAAVVRAMGDADVICFQEIARNDPAIAGGADQVAGLRGLFPGYQVVFGKALDRGDRQYGNALLSRLPVLQVFNHLLPHPAQAGIKHMQRQAIEAVVQTAQGPLRVMTTHLEYFSAAHRAAQVARLREIQAEVAANEETPPAAGNPPYDAVPRPSSLVLCGDFNLLPDDEQYRALFADGLVDAWRKANGTPDPLTTGLYDKAQWSAGPHCRDYFAVTPDVAARIASVAMDDRTAASDHQPLKLVLRDVFSPS